MFKTIFFLLIFSISSAFCGLPIFHLVLSQYWLDNFEKCSKENRDEFIVGSLFPDIRYISSLSREETHIKNLTYAHG